MLKGNIFKLQAYHINYERVKLFITKMVWMSYEGQQRTSHDDQELCSMTGSYSWLRSLMQRCETKDAVKILCTDQTSGRTFVQMYTSFSFEEGMILEWLKSSGEYSIWKTLMGWNDCKSLDKYSTLISSSDIARQLDALPVQVPQPTHRTSQKDCSLLKHRKICIENQGFVMATPIPWLWCP